MSTYTANVKSAVQDPKASVAQIVVEFFRDGVSIETVTYRTGEPGTLPTLVAGQIKEYQRLDALATYLASPTLGPIAPAGQTPPTQDELNARVVSQKVSLLATLKQYVSLGVLDPSDPSIAAAVADATTAVQAVQANKVPLPPTILPLV